MRAAICLGLAITALIWVRSAPAADPYAGLDPYWVLLHEPAAVAELKLTTIQQPKYQALLDELDLRFFPLRNKPQEEALDGQSQLVAEVREQLKTLLQPAQHKRLAEILRRRSGPPALLSNDVASRLKYTDAQREQLQTIMDETKTAVAALEKELAEGKPREPLQKQFQELKTDEYKRLLEVLKPAQQAAWKNLLGANFDLSTLGHPAFKAPELVNTGEWINSAGLDLKSQRGKVVVVHFYAANCINCIRNYPWYNEWHEHFQDQPVVLIGIHTPETAAEREIASVRKKATEANFAFPVLIDGKNANWNAWGNSMWPSVYVIDQRGYLRHFWPGELKWQGNDGEKFMRERIEQLLAETKP